MKKIINGRKYDTETATMIGERTSNSGSFNYVHEELYRKKTGEFFLYGEGGPATGYAKSCGLNTWCSGEMIYPVSEKYARNWVESWMDANEYEEIFGEVEE